jgi:gliding motility-associated-like protein
MKNFSKIILGILLLLPVIVQGQVKKVVRYGELNSNNQDIWGKGGGFDLNINHDIFRVNWNKSGNSGGVTSLAGMKFGGELFASTWGDIGSRFILEGFTSGLASVHYPFNVEYTYPDSATFTVGEKVRFSTKYNVLSTSSLTINNPSAGTAELRMHVGFGFDVRAKLCLFGCANFHLIPNISLPIKDFYLLHVDSSGVIYPSSRANYVCTDYDDESTCISYPVDLPFPGFRKDTSGTYIDVIGGALSGMFELPYSAMVNKYNQYGKKLTAEGEYLYFNLTVDVFKTLSLIPIPPVSTVLGNLSNDFSIAGYGKFSYKIFDMDFPINTYHKHRFEFEPTLYNKIRLSTPVNYAVLDPNGIEIASGQDSVINYPLESSIEIQIPCNSAFVDVLNYDFDIASTKNFSNHTYDSLSIELAMTALQFSITLPKVQVVPKICFPEICLTLPYPCKKCKKKWGVKVCWPWVCTKRVCTPPFCTPEITFDGFEFGVGPLWTYSQQLGSTKIDWFENQWEFGGFSPYIDTNRIFRLYPVEYKVELAKTDVLCYGDSTAQVSATISGGTAPYTIEWSNGITNHTSNSNNQINNLPAGSYFVTITDANGCEIYNSIEVLQPALPLASEVIEVRDVLCFGNSTGAINLSSNGGTAPYTYQWSGPGSFSNGAEDIDNLTTGQYYVEISDKHGCKTYDTAFVDQPAMPISGTMTSEDVLCNGDNSGFAEIAVKGGTPPYSYNWSNGDTLKYAENLSAGNYYVTVNDVYNCSFKDTAIINQPLQPIQLTITGTDVNCFGGEDGTIDLTATGGTQPYSYTWANGENIELSVKTEDLNNIPADKYSVLVEDKNACQDTISIEIKQPTQIITGLEKTDISCFAGNDGQIDLSVTGGQKPYTYKWSNGMSSQDISGIPAGNYSVEVADKANCKVYDSISLSQPNAPLTPVISSKDVKCFGEISGEISLRVSGGTSPYRYSWSNGDTISELEKLAAGLYTVTITDAKGCLSYTGKQIEEPTAPLSFNHSITNPSCNGNSDGLIEIVPDGGTPPYYFRWDDTLLLFNRHAEKLHNLKVGTYHIEISDANGCKIENDFTLTQPDILTLDYITKIVSCFGGDDGEIDLTIIGGTLPYSFNWSNGDNTEDVTGLEAGYYNVTVTDNQDCEAEEMMKVDEMPEIVADYETTEISCSDQDDGNIVLFVSGGAGGYSFLWSTGDTTKNIHNQEAGFYSVKITDNNGCVKELNDIEIYFNESVCINIPTSFTPNDDGTNDQWILRNVELYPNAVVKVFNRWGNLVFESNGYQNPWDGRYDGEALPSATYYYVIELNNGEKPYTGTVTIVR